MRSSRTRSDAGCVRSETGSSGVGQRSLSPLVRAVLLLGPGAASLACLCDVALRSSSVETIGKSSQLDHDSITRCRAAQRLHSGHQMGTVMGSVVGELGEFTDPLSNSTNIIDALQHLTWLLVSLVTSNHRPAFIWVASSMGVSPPEPSSPGPVAQANYPCALWVTDDHTRRRTRLDRIEGDLHAS